MTIDVLGVIDSADLHALVLVDTELHRVGKELHGPCPLCVCVSTERRHRCDRFRLDATRKHWYCRHCAPQGGSAIDYAQRRYGVGFREACAIAVGNHHATPLAPGRRHRTTTGPSLPSATWQARGQQLVADAVECLWSAAGTRARAYLHGRGLTAATIHAWQLGYLAQGAAVPAGDWGLLADRDVYLHRGILIPWFTSNGALAGLKIRKPVPTTVRNKYASITGSTYRLFGTPTIVAAEPLILVEGEFDALAAWQALGDRAATVALGTARQPDAAEFRLLSLASPVLVALDGDEVGDRVADQLIGLSENCRRARPPDAKDLSACVERGTDLDAWFTTHLSSGVQSAS